MVSGICDLAGDAALVGSLFEARINDAEFGAETFDDADLAVPIEVVRSKADCLLLAQLAIGFGIARLLSHDATILLGWPAGWRTERYAPPAGLSGQTLEG